MGKLLLEAVYLTQKHGMEQIGLKLVKLTRQEMLELNLEIQAQVQYILQERFLVHHLIYELWLNNGMALAGLK